MANQQYPTSLMKQTSLLVYGLMAVGLLGIIGFSLFYILSSHAHLVDWYKGLNSCFYRNATWDSEFFNPRIKKDGNMYCGFAMAMAGYGLFYIYKKLKFKQEPTGTSLVPELFSASLKDTIPLLASLVSAFALWYWGFKTALPAYDEVFSAQNAAGIHPFQCVSFYMLPNNHLFFNLLNSFFFSSFTDKVISGRIISLIAYLGFAKMMYLWGRSVFNSRWLASLLSVVLCSQFMVWGFASQARGYEIYLLAEIGIVLTTLNYITTGKGFMKYINIASIAIGYFCMPSFMYMHLACMVVYGINQIATKRKDSTFWKAQLAGLLLTFLCYLPALCFSGLDFIAHNNYVAPMKFKTTYAFGEWMYPNFLIYLNHLFSDLTESGFHLGYVFFLAPCLMMLARKNKAISLAGGFYIAMWLIFFIVALKMKRLPFERNLIGHYSLTLFCNVLLIYWLVSVTLGKIKPIKIAVFSLILIITGAYFVATNKTLQKETLYEYDANGRYEFISKGLEYIPKGATVACSDEGFYYGYICLKHGCKLSKCPTGNEDYFVKPCFEDLPPIIAKNYNEPHIIYDYAVYKHK